MAISKIVEVKARPPKISEAFWQGKFEDFPQPNGRPSAHKLISSKALDKKFKESNYEEKFDLYMDRSLYLAELWAEKYASLLTQNPIEERITSPRVEDAQNSFLSWLKSEKKAHKTIQSYRTHFDLWLELNKNHFCHTISQSMVDRYSERASEITPSTHTNAKYISNQKKFWNWCKSREYVKQLSITDSQDQLIKAGDAVTLLWPNIKRTENKVKEFTPNQFIAYGNAVMMHPNPNAKRAFLLINEFGGRRNEVYSLKLEDINLFDGYITLGKTKQGSEGEKKPISDTMIEYLKEDLSSRNSKEIYYLDNGTGNLQWSNQDLMTACFSKILKRLGIRGVKPLHGLRAGFITNGAREGGDNFTLKGLAGHAKLDQTLDYTSDVVLEKKGKVLVNQINSLYPKNWFKNGEITENSVLPS